MIIIQRVCHLVLKKQQTDITTTFSYNWTSEHDKIPWLLRDLKPFS